MSFDAARRLRDASSSASNRALVDAARDARTARAVARAVEAAARACQRTRRASAQARARRAARAARLVDALADAGGEALWTTCAPAVATWGADACGWEAAFRVFALALKRREEASSRIDLGGRRALCRVALHATADGEVRRRLPALAACGARLAGGLCESDEKLARSIHGLACEALRASLSDDGFEHRGVVAQALASLALEPLARASSSEVRRLVERLMCVPRLRAQLPRDSMKLLEDSLRQVLEACAQGLNGGESVVAAIENVMDLLCGGVRNGNLRRFALADECNASVALRALTGLSASARKTIPDWYERLSRESGWRASATSALGEAWFLTGLIGDTDAELQISSPEKAGLAAILYTELSRASEGGVFSPCAFSLGYLHSLWVHVAQKLSLAASLPFNGTPRDWIARPFERDGVLDLPLESLRGFAFFCSTYAHRLVVLRDAQFFDEQKPFSLDEQRAIAVAVNTLTVRSHASDRTHAMTSDMRRVLDAASALLHALTTRDARRSFAPQGMWLAPNTIKLEPSVAASAFQTFIEQGQGTQITGLLVDCPHAISFDDRVKIFRELIKADRLKAGYRPQAGGVDATHRDSFVRPVAQVNVRRETVLEDCLSALLPLGAAARGRVLVKFVNSAGQEEAGIDAGGLFKELLSLVTEQGLNPNRGLFATNATGLVYVSPRAGDTDEGLLLLELIGIMIGKGLYEGILQDINMASFFAAHILGTPRTIDDIPSLDEELARSVVQIVEYDGDVADLSLDFTCSEEVYGQIVTKELVSGGKEIQVNNANRLLFVHLLADYHLNRRISTPMNAFMRGLTKIINRRWFGLFNAKELSLLLSGGESAIDVDDWMRHTQYSGGYTAKSATVKNFWRALRKFTPELRQEVLRFVTSSPRPPLQGFKHLNPPFVIHKVSCEASIFASLGGSDVQRLPSASTCFNMLKLPNYRRASTLEKSITYAARSRAGFELS